MEKVVSSIKYIPYSPQIVYHRLSDLRNVEKVKERVKANPELAEQLQAQGINFDIEDLVCEADNLRLSISGVGELGLVIAEREENKTLKMDVTGVPVTANLWIQLLPDGEAGERTKMKLTLGYDIPFFLRAMLKGKLSKLQDGIEKMAELLAGLQYE